MSLQRLTLVLNASYEPINVITARRAVTMVMKGIARTEARSPFVVRTARMTIPIPSVIKLEEYRKIPHMSRSVSRKTILMRDRYTCQYCLQRFLPKLLTLDHVMPRSRNGEETWENLVAACVRCNNRKANRTPAEAGMLLSRRPAAIGIHAKHRLLAGADQPDWEPYLFV